MLGTTAEALFSIRGLTRYRRKHVGFVFQFYNLIPSLTAKENVAIARAIAERPGVLLCDEPTGALDVETGVLVLEAIEQVNREMGTTVVVITHNTDIAAMADRVISLSDGRIGSEQRNERRRTVAGARSKSTPPWTASFCGDCSRANGSYPRASR